MSVALQYSIISYKTHYQLYINLCTYFFLQITLNKNEAFLSLTGKNGKIRRNRLGKLVENRAKVAKVSRRVLLQESVH